MRRTLSLIALILFLTAGMAHGQFAGGGQASGTTVAAAKSMPDDSWVSIEGNIVKRVDHEHYTFKDATGEISVEIDNDVWHGQTVGPDTKVRIHGELDRDIFSSKIDVDRLEIVQQGAQTGGGFKQ